MIYLTTYEHQAITCPPQADPLRHTTYEIRYTSHPNRRNCPKAHRPTNKPPIWPKLSTKYEVIIINKPNLLNALMNVNKVLTKDYENIANCRLCKNKPNTNPIKPNFPAPRGKTNPNKPNFKPGMIIRT